MEANSRRQLTRWSTGCTCNGCGTTPSAAPIAGPHSVDLQENGFREVEGEGGFAMEGEGVQCDGGGNGKCNPPEGVWLTCKRRHSYDWHAQ